MKILKKIYTTYFFHVNSETGRNHGLWNDVQSGYPFGIGYVYQNNKKGFWLKIDI